MTFSVPFVSVIKLFGLKRSFARQLPPRYSMAMWPEEFMTLF